MPDLLPPTMFCTDGNVNSVIGTCHGDSGGPLIKKYGIIIWMEMENENDCLHTYMHVHSTPMYLYFVVAREIDLTDGAQTYTLVGVVNGNPKGCRDERDFPDYHTSIGNAEVCTHTKYAWPHQ